MSTTVKAVAILIAKLTLLYLSTSLRLPTPHPEHNPQVLRAKLVCAISVTADPAHHLGATGGTAAGSEVETGSSPPGCRGMGQSKAVAAPGTTP